MSACRLAIGGRLDRSQSLEFFFNGRRFTGFRGDTLASALLANDVQLLARSFKYHRPRGLLSAGSEEPNALVQLENGAYSEPNTRTTQIELYAGLQARSQNCWPSVNFDLAAVNTLLAPLLPAGFYYKTFMWPAQGWRRYEKLIRAAAGLGHAPRLADPDRYEKTHRHCDVLVVGAGPAGLTAALAAARRGADVIVADEQSEPGGSLLDNDWAIRGKPAAAWLSETLVELAGHDNVTLLPRTTVTAMFDHSFATMVQRCSDHLPIAQRAGKIRQRLWKVRAAQIILGTGAHERPLIFVNNDRPGVMLASAAARYAGRYAVLAGQRIVLTCNNTQAYHSAAALAGAGAAITVLDSRARPPRQCLQLAENARLRVFEDTRIARVLGRRRVRSVEISSKSTAGSINRLDCDLLLMSGGFNPVVHLFAQARGRLVYDDRLQCFVPAADWLSDQESLQVLGAAAGCFETNALLEHAERAGAQAVDHHPRIRHRVSREPARGITDSSAVSKRSLDSEPTCQDLIHSPTQGSVDALGIESAWPLEDSQFGAAQFVDFQNDVTLADLRMAALEGYSSVEHAKRYTTAGMGTDQGKTSNVNALALLGIATQRTPGQVGTTTFRPPYTPVSFGVLAGRDRGRLFDPVRTTPMHDWHVHHGARFENVGQWQRPWYYPRDGESMREAVNRECLAVRNEVGVLDASTLGKIQLCGEDTPVLLNWLYTNGFSKLEPGRCRYGLMCGEDGMIFDDGVTVRLDEHRWLMHTTTGNAARVLAWLEEWLQTEWPHLRVYCTSVSEQWATAAISGPKARALLCKLGTDIDLSAAAFPFMSYRSGTVAGLPARVMRISFTGELCFEIGVAADHGQTLWDQLMQCGQTMGITPFGTETMHVLRAEKGFIIAGQETDGTVTPRDLGMDGLVAKHKDFLGKRSLQRKHLAGRGRRQLVGLLTEDPQDLLSEGAQLVTVAGAPPLDMHGHVTSSYWSANLGRSIALAMVRDGHARIGERLLAPQQGKTIAARITTPCFYDPTGERMRG